MRTHIALLALIVGACGSSSSSQSTGTTGPTTEGTGGETTAPAAEPDPNMIVIHADDRQWKPLDPDVAERGLMISPTWGDMQTGASGFFVRLPTGFSGASHTHTANYNAVVIEGGVVNAPPSAASPPVLPPGSHWAQPGGDAHITACPVGCTAWAYMDGPFDGAPAAEDAAAPQGKLTPYANLQWNPMDPNAPDGPQLAIAWGNPMEGEAGFFVKMPGNFSNVFHSHTHDYHAVIIEGITQHAQPGGEAEARDLPAGSYWFQPANDVHIDKCVSAEPCVAYVHMMGKLDFFPAPAK